MKFILLIISIITMIIGIEVLDEIEGEEATIFGIICLVFGAFLGIIALMSFSPM